MHRPGQVARRLSISPATLRVWSGEFGAFLSDAARKSLTETGTRTQRRYTDGDLASLHRAKNLLGQGLTYAEVRDALRQPPAETEASASASDPVTPDLTPASEVPSAALATIEQYRLTMAALHETTQAQARHIADLQAERDRANERAARSESELVELRRAMLARQAEPERPRRPWWKFWERDE